jgi:hypothetical protein
VPYRENANLILRGQEAVEREVTALAIGNHEFAEFTDDDAAAPISVQARRPMPRFGRALRLSSSAISRLIAA